jgi:hypothetical protein
MKRKTTPLFFFRLLLLLPFSSATAQLFPENYTHGSVTIRSDFPSKSVLVSNLIVDKTGDMSPIIGAASWADSGKQLQCRSLLEFNYFFMPPMVMRDPSLITSAELILYPVQVTDNQNDLNKTSRIIVRRVLEDWEDSSTMWANQPVADSTMQVKEFLKKKHKTKPVSVDVTGQVMDMIRYGNNGFMICYDPANTPDMTLSQWFASPKNEDQNKRPLLVINYKQMQNPSLTGRKETGMDALKRQLDREELVRQQTQASTAPVPEPVKTNPVKD